MTLYDSTYPCLLDLVGLFGISQSLGLVVITVCGGVHKTRVKMAVVSPNAITLPTG